MEKLEKILEKWKHVPTIEETGPVEGANAPLMIQIRKKIRICYAVLAAAGFFPWLLSCLSRSKPDPRIVNMFLGLVVPGGGFMANGNWYGWLIGLGILFIFFTWGRNVVEWYGNIVAMPMLWLIGCLGGLWADQPVTFQNGVVPCTAAVLTIIYFEVKQARLEKKIMQTRKARISRFKEIMKPVEKLQQRVIVESDPPGRELDAEALKAAGYLFDMTVREKGDFTEYNKTSINSMGAYRYQFASLGYALMLMQCKYTPNFHGYQNQAWRFLIDAFTDPRCCGYWKWEYLGGRLRWDPDPVANENIMLSGWMLPVVNAYGAHTGDRRYEQADALCFRPFMNERKQRYGYSAEELTKVLTTQWSQKKYPGMLIPCEPHIAFPICNSYGLLGSIIYDRDHGTDYAAEILDKYNEHLKEEFVEADGTVADMRHYLFGACRYLHKPAMNVSPIGGISIGLQYAPLYPGLAKRCYALVRDEVVEIRSGMAYLKGMPWEQAMDLGTMTKNPSMYCGLLAQLACEYGDTELLQAVRAVERLYLKASKNPRVLRYKDVAVINMAYLCLSRWARQGDWYDTIHHGPDKNALRGPVLSDCAYPEVMVARAMSTNGEDLELILSGKGEQKIELARLKPLHVYSVDGLGKTIQADTRGNASLQLRLEERTEIRIRRVV